MTASTPPVAEVPCATRVLGHQPTAAFSGHLRVCVEGVLRLHVLSSAFATEAEFMDGYYDRRTTCACPICCHRFASTRWIHTSIGLDDGRDWTSHGLANPSTDRPLQALRWALDFLRLIDSVRHPRQTRQLHDMMSWGWFLLSKVRKQCPPFVRRRIHAQRQQQGEVHRQMLNPHKPLVSVLRLSAEQGMVHGGSFQHCVRHAQQLAKDSFLLVFFHRDRMPQSKTLRNSPGSGRGEK